jgi:predicted transcriptional regulator
MSEKPKPAWYDKAVHMRADLGWTYAQIAADLCLCEQTVRLCVRVPRRCSVTTIGYVKPSGPKPDWAIEAEKLRAGGMAYDKIATATGRSKSAITRWLIGKPIRTDHERATASVQKKPKRRPIAGEVNQSIMDAARLFASGKIDRAELSARLRRGA